MTNLKSDPFSAFGKFILIIATAVYGCVARGYTLKVLWAWFFVPAFGLRALSIPEALGLMLVAESFKPTPTGKSEPTTESFGAVFFGAFLRITLTCAIALGVGWVYRLFL